MSKLEELEAAAVAARLLHVIAENEYEDSKSASDDAMIALDEAEDVVWEAEQEIAAYLKGESNE